MINNMLSETRGPLSMSTFSTVMAINVNGSVHTAKHAAIAMSKNQEKNGERGVIILVSSLAAEEGQKGQVAYSASKGALNAMVLPMARDLGKYKIRVAAVAPGIFATPLSAILPSKAEKSLIAATPMGRYGSPDEFAHMACFCIENGYINGVSLRIDGAIKLPNL